MEEVIESFRDGFSHAKFDSVGISRNSHRSMDGALTVIAILTTVAFSAIIYGYYIHRKREDFIVVESKDPTSPLL